MSWFVFSVLLMFVSFSLPRGNDAPGREDQIMILVHIGKVVSENGVGG